MSHSTTSATKCFPCREVYLVQASNGLYKIGMAVDSFKRLETIVPPNGSALTLIHFIEHDPAYMLEKALHHRFATKRVHGEWFALSPDDVTEFLAIGTDAAMALIENHRPGSGLPLPQRLKDLMDASELTITEIARRLQTTRATVYNLLNGTHTDPAFSLVQKIADLFGVTTDSLRSTS